MDPESLQKSDRRRGCCKDVFLFVSITFLFMGLSAVSVCEVMRILDSRQDSQRRTINVDSAKQTSDPVNHGYKMQNFAELDIISGELKTSTVELAPVFYGSSKSIGSNFDFDKAQYSLKPLKEGTYFMYMTLNLSCTFNCSAGVLSVQVGNKLTCNVELQAGPTATPVSKQCFTVTRLHKEGLVTQMSVPQDGLENWKLESKGSRLGMFLVD